MVTKLDTLIQGRYPKSFIEKKAQQLGICFLYRNNLDFRISYGMIDALAFLPLREVIDGIVYLYTTIPV